MMKLKRFLAPLMATAITVGAMPISNVTAASPRISVDITYENNDRVRADIKFENVPEAAIGAFHVTVGDGFDLVLKVPDSDMIDGTNKNCQSGDLISARGQKTGEREIFVTFNSPYNVNVDLNQCFYSFYLEKNENFCTENAKVNVEFRANANAADFIADKDGHYLIDADSNATRTMLRAHEYIIGDVNNDGRVNSIDSTLIRSAIPENAACRVDNLHDTLSAFPDAACAAAPDATLNGVINYEDADVIMQYYIDMSTGKTNDSRIGTREFYEIYQR